MAKLKKRNQISKLPYEMLYFIKEQLKDINDLKNLSVTSQLFKMVMYSTLTKLKELFRYFPHHRQLIRNKIKEGLNVDFEFEQLTQLMEIDYINLDDRARILISAVKKNDVSTLKVSQLKLDEINHIQDKTKRSLLTWAIDLKNLDVLNYFYSLAKKKYKLQSSTATQKKFEGDRLLNWAVCCLQPLSTIKDIISLYPDNQPKKGLSLAFCNAVQEELLYIAKYLLDNGAEVDYVNTNSVTPLLYASQNGDLEMISLLVNKGAVIDKSHKNGATALYIAAQNGHSNSVKMLLKKGAKINKACKDGSTPLCIAVETGHLNIVKILLENKAKINKTCKDGSTPLYTHHT